MEFTPRNIYIIRGDSSQLPDPLPAGIVVFTNNSTYSLDLNQFVSGGSPPYSFQLLGEGVKFPANYSISATIQNDALVVNLVDDPATFSVPTVEYQIRVRDAKQNQVDGTLTFYIPIPLRWRDGVDSTILTTVRNVAVSQEVSVNLSNFYTGGHLDHLHFKRDRIIDLGGEVIQDIRPRSDIRNFVEAVERTDVDFTGENIGDRRPAQNFIMYNNPFASILQRVEIVDSFGRKIQGEVRFFSRLEWVSNIPVFDVNTNVNRSIDLSEYLVTGRRDNSIGYNIVTDTNGVFDIVSSAANVMVLRFVPFRLSNLPSTFQVIVNAYDRAYPDDRKSGDVTLNFRIG